MSAAQASAAGCIGCDAGTQWAKRHSTALSCAMAGLAKSTAASAMPRSCVMRSSLRAHFVIDYYSLPRFGQDLYSGDPCSSIVRRAGWAFLPIRIGERVVLLGPDLVAGFAEQRRRQAGERRVHVDRFRPVRGDADILRQQTESKSARELARDDVLLDNARRVELLRR